MAVVSLAGATRWKNARFDEAVGGLSSGAAGDLGRVLALFRHTGEAPLETLQRLVTSDAPVRTAVAERGLCATATRVSGGLLVEVDELDSATLEALTETHEQKLPAQRTSGAVVVPFAAVTPASG
jgi:hypothetical protein